MSEVIPFPGVRYERRDQDKPDPGFTCTDEDGRIMGLFAIDFLVNDPETGDEREFSVSVWAYDREDAERRLDCLKQTGRLAGQIMGEVPMQ